MTPINCVSFLTGKCVHVCVPACLRVFVCVTACVTACRCTFVCVFVLVCVRACMYECVCACLCVCVCVGDGGSFKKTKDFRGSGRCVKQHRSPISCSYTLELSKNTQVSTFCSQNHKKLAKWILLHVDYSPMVLVFIEHCHRIHIHTIYCKYRRYFLQYIQYIDMYRSQTMCNAKWNSDHPQNLGSSSHGAVPAVLWKVWCSSCSLVVSTSLMTGLSYVTAQ